MIPADILTSLVVGLFMVLAYQAGRRFVRRIWQRIEAGGGRD